MHKLRILCDLDSIVVNLSKKWVARYNKDYGTSLTVEDVQKKWHMSQNVPYGRDEVHKYLYEPGFFLDLEPFPGAIETLKFWDSRGHEIIIVTSPSHPGTSASDKITWVQNHAPFIHKRKVALVHDKHYFKGDVFIDDSPDHLKRYRDENLSAFIATIAYPYNDVVKRLVDVRAESCKDMQNAWKELREAVNARACDTASL